MKINKITMIVFAIGTLLSGIMIWLINNAVIQNIVSGVFTGFIVSLVVSIIGYYYEKNIILEKTDYNLKSLYINMSVISRIIGNMLSHVFKTEKMESLPFKDISELSQYNVNLSEQMNLGLFAPIWKRGKVAQVYKDLIEFQQVIYNIKSISLDLQVLSKDFTIKTLELQNKQMMGIQSSLADNENIENIRNLIIVKSSKLHEYITGKILELDKIADLFYECKIGKKSWQEIKHNLTQEIENIVMR